MQFFLNPTFSLFKVYTSQLPIYTSQISSRIEYLKPTLAVFSAILHLANKSVSLTDLNRNFIAASPAITNVCLRHCSCRAMSAFQSCKRRNDAAATVRAMSCCVLVDPCSSVPCQNSANCTSDVVSMTYTCDCSANFTGVLCETRENTCRHVISCLNTSIHVVIKLTSNCALYAEVGKILTFKYLKY